MFTATLRCGTVLAYEARSFLPEVGDLVPCRHHGYCTVTETTRGTGPGDFLPRATPRTQDELMEWLRHRPETTVHALRRQRFTLRVVAAAERDGLVDLDLRAGRVALRSAKHVSRATTCRETTRGTVGAQDGDLYRRPA
jgi:hypothetical protein